LIVRSWSGFTLPSQAADYIRYLQETILPELRTIDGHRGAYILRRELETEVEFQVLSLWDSLDAIRRFAGQDPDSAVVPEPARALLERFDDRVRHYEVIAAPELAP
jgi:heme-degrading monooxygenase HmoA